MPLTLSVDRQRSLMTMWLDDTFNIVVSNFSSQVGATVPSQWCLYGRLKIVADLASLTALGRLFHSPITLELKKLFLNSWLFFFFNSLSVPVVALVSLSSHPLSQKSADCPRHSPVCRSGSCAVALS